jgi:hypothetical protein
MSRPKTSSGSGASEISAFGEERGAGVFGKGGYPVLFFFSRGAGDAGSRRDRY